MTQGEIIEMLELVWKDRLKAAVLAEREACAKVCEDSVEYAGGTLADLIRARGQA